MDTLRRRDGGKDESLASVPERDDAGRDSDGAEIW
jgi:hypothetical protein